MVLSAWGRVYCFDRRRQQSKSGNVKCTTRLQRTGLQHCISSSGPRGPAQVVWALISRWLEGSRFCTCNALSRLRTNSGNILAKSGACAVPMTMPMMMAVDKAMPAQSEHVPLREQGLSRHQDFTSCSAQTLKSRSVSRARMRPY